MANVSPAGFFEEFNAKYLEPQRVAESFVMSKHFVGLAGPHHGVLVGPRGSGKTTLLKMLQPAALGNWRDSAAEDFRSAVAYSGVFVSSDIGWSKQLQALGYGRLSPTNHEALTIACFTTHVVKAIVSAMHARLDQVLVRGYQHVELSRESEAALVHGLANALMLQTEIASLLSLGQALSKRLSDIRAIANSGSHLNQIEFASHLSGTAWLHLDCLAVAAAMFELFNDHARDQNRVWALLFDELETAPDWIVRYLIGAIRSGSSKILLKLAISPASLVAYGALTSDIAPVAGQDHQVIRLWYSDRVESREFCEALWNQLVKKRGLSVGPQQALGPSLFDPYEDRRGAKRSPYMHGEAWHDLFRRLADRDASFRAFLRARNVDLENSAIVSQKIRDEVLRKAAPIAAVREFFLKVFSDEGALRRTRKSTELYAGANSVFSISEGNPRWFIGLVSPLIRLLKTNQSRIPAAVQAAEIDRVVDRLLSVVQTIPVARTSDRYDQVGLLTILETIGKELHKDLVLGNFQIDPKLNFLVDSAIPEHIRELLAAGLNRGAVILVEEPTSQPVVGDLRGARLRLSYLLAARYGLPLRRGRTKELSRLIHKHIRNPSNPGLGLAVVQTELNLDAGEPSGST